VGGKRSGVSRKRAVVPKYARPGWLRRMDQRSRAARALSTRLLGIADDLGGLEHLSGIQRSLLERFIHAEALAVSLEESARGGEEFELAHYLAVVDRVVRLGMTLGLTRAAKRMPTLREYIDSTATSSTEEAPPEQPGRRASTTHSDDVATFTRGDDE
jgi:hypothetical protein